MLIETRHLTKRYGTLAALDDCSLAVRTGEVFGLLGPNGAGKTTLLRLLLGFLRPSAGTAIVDGHDCVRDSVAVRRRVAYLPGEVRLFRRMRGFEALQFFIDIRPGTRLARGRELAERLELDLSRRIAAMSSGMRQKLAIVAVFAAETPILVLDEPTTHLDPTARRDLLALVREAQAAGRTVLFSSHVFSEVEEACDRVGILRQGKIVDVQSLADVKRQHRVRLWLNGPWQPPPTTLAAHLRVVHNDDGAVTMETPNRLAPLLGWLATLPVAEMQIEPLGLRAIYERHHGE